MAPGRQQSITLEVRWIKTHLDKMYAEGTVTKADTKVGTPNNDVIVMYCSIYLIIVATLELV